jgi:glucose-6-phosphate 1-dehydrogenase
MKNIEINNCRQTPGGLKQNKACVIVIFGVSGDLARKKIIPALFNLFDMGMLHENTRIIGIGRRKYSNIEYNEYIKNAVINKPPCSGGTHKNNPCDKKIEDFIRINNYHTADFTVAEEYSAIKEFLKQTASENKICDFLYYLSTPPANFEQIITSLHQSGLSRPDFLDISCAGSFVRVIIEKPYGYDISSARALNAKVLSIFSEDQIYRIDHYLGKETVQNIMVFRFINGIFEPVWNHKYIHNVQIKVYESDGIGSRANYFDKSGIIRDIIQNHSLQILSMIAMEPAASIDANSVRNEKLKVLQSIRPFDTDNPVSSIVTGRYGPGIIGGLPVKGYTDEDNIDKNSATETFAAIKLFIDNWRWAGVPFYLCAAKRMPERLSEIIITFKPAPHLLFNNLCASQEAISNELTIRIQPDEGISLKIFCKRPGFETRLQPVSMNFNYSASFDQKMPEAYERLILDALNGDATLFMRSDEIETAWNYITPILKCLEQKRVTLNEYAAGSLGPKLCEFFGLDLC